MVRENEKSEKQTKGNKNTIKRSRYLQEVFKPKLGILESKCLFNVKHYDRSSINPGIKQLEVK